MCYVASSAVITLFNQACSGLHSYTLFQTAEDKKCEGPAVSERHFHLAEKHQSPSQEEILLGVHWAVDDNETKTDKQKNKLVFCVFC